MKLHEVCDLIVDCPHTTAKDEGNGYALIRTPNIGKGRLELNGVHRVSKQVYDSRNSRAIPQANDLILAREAPVGNVAKILEGQEVCLGQRTVLIRPDKSKVSPDFLTYYLLSPEQQYNLTSAANGATVSHLNMGNIRNLKIDLPPRSKQDKIASILSAYDDMIVNCKAQTALLKEAAQRLYREWFVDLRFPGFESAPIGKNGLPNGWELGKISSLGSFSRGKNMLTMNAHGGDIPVIAGGLSPSCFHDVPNTVAPVITVSGSGANAGYAALFTTDVWASDCSYIDSNSSDDIFYIFCYLKNNPKILFSKQKGSAQPHVYARDINETPLIIPSPDVRKSFSKLVSKYFFKIGVLNSLCTNALKARDILLPRLISGQIEINA